MIRPEKFLSSLIEECKIVDLAATLITVRLVNNSANGTFKLIPLLFDSK
jgi:hypothetical protein